MDEVAVRAPEASFEGALTSAYVMALRRRRPVVTSDLVLYCAARRLSLLHERLPIRRPLDVRVPREDPAPANRTMLRPAIDDAVAWEAAATMRRAIDVALRRKRAFRAIDPARRPAFSPAVQHAVYEAIHEAARRETRHAAVEHLVLGLLATPESAACRALDEMLPTADERMPAMLRRLPKYLVGGKPRRHPAATWLTDLQILPMADPTRFERLSRLFNSMVMRLFYQRPYRRHGALYGHPLLSFIELGAADIARDYDRATVTSADILVSVAEWHEEQQGAGQVPPAYLARWNHGGDILVRHGIDAASAKQAAHELEPQATDAEEILDAIPTRGWPKRFQRHLPTSVSPAPGRTALAALRGASLDARRRGHPFAGTTLLLAFTLAEADGPAARLLRRLGVDPAQVRAEALESLARQES